SIFAAADCPVSWRTTSREFHAPSLASQPVCLRSFCGSRLAGMLVISQMLYSWRNYIFAVALIVATLFAYRPVWRGTALMDDDAYLISKPELRTVSGLVRIWTEPQTAPQEHLRQYHPLCRGSRESCPSLPSHRPDPSGDRRVSKGA